METKQGVRCDDPCHVVTEIYLWFIINHENFDHANWLRERERERKLTNMNLSLFQNILYRINSFIFNLHEYFKFWEPSQDLPKIFHVSNTNIYWKQKLEILMLNITEKRQVSRGMSSFTDVVSEPSVSRGFKEIIEKIKAG